MSFTIYKTDEDTYIGVSSERGIIPQFMRKMSSGDVSTNIMYFERYLSELKDAPIGTSYEFERLTRIILDRLKSDDGVDELLKNGALVNEKTGLLSTYYLHIQFASQARERRQEKNVTGRSEKWEAFKIKNTQREKAEDMVGYTLVVNGCEIVGVITACTPDELTVLGSKRFAERLRNASHDGLVVFGEYLEL